MVAGWSIYPAALFWTFIEPINFDLSVCTGGNYSIKGVLCFLPFSLFCPHENFFAGRITLTETVLISEYDIMFI